MLPYNGIVTEFVYSFEFSKLTFDEARDVFLKYASYVGNFFL